MKKGIIIGLCLICCLLAVSCKDSSASSKAAGSSSSSFKDLSTATEKYWYAMGADLLSYYTEYYAEYADDFDVDAFNLGVKDFANDSFALTSEEMNAIASDYYAVKDAQASKEAEENLAKAEAFLEENKKKDGVVTTESGLQYKVFTLGNGEKPTDDDVVEVNYELSLMDGTVIESTYDYGQTASFSLNGVIEGFAEGLKLMPVGSTYELYIHPSIGYGTESTGSFGGNTLLIFKVELVSISAN